MVLTEGSVGKPANIAKNIYPMIRIIRMIIICPLPYSMLDVSLHAC
jgi:hypothetical protein